MDKRGAFRFPTEVEADCRSCDRTWNTRLVNISTTGCMIACPVDGLPHGPGPAGRRHPAGVAVDDRQGCRRHPEDRRGEGGHVLEDAVGRQVLEDLDEGAVRGVA